MLVVIMYAERRKQCVLQITEQCTRLRVYKTATSRESIFHIRGFLSLITDSDLNKYFAHLHHSGTWKQNEICPKASQEFGVL